MAEEQALEVQETNDDSIWLDTAREAYEKSTTFVDNNYRKQWENNIRHFQSRHAAGSKYYGPSYTYRSKIFRPKTRAAIRNHEAAAVAAFFANRDVVSIEPENDNDPIQRASAEINEALLQYRLTKTIPWFLILIGAYQDSMVPGVACAYIDWEYEALEEEGMPLKDQPLIRLLPVENLRIDPAADWTNPVASSPYLIELMPMYIGDVRQKMLTINSKTGQPGWRNLGEDVLRTARSQKYDSTRQVRERQRTDKTDPQSPGVTTSMYDIVWVHRNIVKVKHQDWVYYTLGTEHMLSDPRPLPEVYFHGQRPYVMGWSVIETHTIYPPGLGQLGESIQQELNENANQRLDNVKLVLNKRYFVKRGSQVDLKSIVRNAAGSVTMVNSNAHGDPDVAPVEFHDVTGSSYQEQDRLNVDFDEIVGNFSTSSVQTNRKLNETVGGMNMLRVGANSLTEYSLRTFSETFVEPLIRLLVKLEQKYETDMTVLALAAQKAQIYQKYGIDRITDQLLNQELTTTVTVGLGATDPIMRMQNFVMGMKVILEVLTTTPPGTLDIMEVAKEVFGYLGFKDGTRFFVQAMAEDPEKMQMGMIIQQLQMVIQQLQAQLQNKLMDNDAKLTMTQMKEEGQDRRTAQSLRTQLEMKAMDLLNPVPGEVKGKEANASR